MHVCALFFCSLDLQKIILSQDDLDIELPQLRFLKLSECGTVRQLSSLLISFLSVFSISTRELNSLHVLDQNMEEIHARVRSKSPSLAGEPLPEFKPLPVFKPMSVFKPVFKRRGAASHPSALRVQRGLRSALDQPPSPPFHLCFMYLSLKAAPWQERTSP
jgi:hypothetical protein